MKRSKNAYFAFFSDEPVDLRRDRVDDRSSERKLIQAVRETLLIGTRFRRCPDCDRKRWPGYGFRLRIYIIFILIFVPL